MSEIIFKASEAGPVPARVFACLVTGKLRVVLYPGVGLADGGIHFDAPIDEIPFELRLPNTPLWLQFDNHMKILRAWHRDEKKNSQPA